MDRPQMDVEEFEALAWFADREELGVRLEYLYGKLSAQHGCSGLGVEGFEKLASYAEQEGMSARLEFVYGKLGVKPLPDVQRAEVIRWTARRILPIRGELRLYQSLKLAVEPHLGGRAQPDGVFAPDDAFTDQVGHWVDPGPVLMAMEVTAYESDSDEWVRIQKPRAYAAAGIPLYLLIDRENRECVVHSAIEDGIYTATARRKFGRPLELPEPVDVVLDTEELKVLAD